MPVQNTQLAGYLLIENRSYFLQEEGSVAWFYDCLHVFWLLYEIDKSFDCIPIYYQDIVMCIDTKTRQISNYAIPITCSNFLQKIFALDPDHDWNYELIPKPVLRTTPTLFEPKRVQSTKPAATFTSQEAGIRSYAELTSFWNLVPFKKLSDTTLRFRENLSILTFWLFLKTTQMNFFFKFPQN